MNKSLFEKSLNEAVYVSEDIRAVVKQLVSKLPNALPKGRVTKLSNSYNFPLNSGKGGSISFVYVKGVILILK